ncbi:hypothetical protein D3C71_1734300 [compost metagenome]
MAEGQHFGQQGIGATVGGGVAEFDQRMQATSDSGAGNFRAVTDLSDGQMPLALLECLHDSQPTRQRRHEVRVTGHGLDSLGGRRDDRRCD